MTNPLLRRLSRLVFAAEEKQTLAKGFRKHMLSTHLPIMTGKRTKELQHDLPEDVN